MTLRGLGSEYAPIVAAINSQTKCPSYPAVSGMLLDFEHRLGLSQTTPAAFTTTATPGPAVQTPSKPFNPSRSSSFGRSQGGRGRGAGRIGRGWGDPHLPRTLC